MEVVQNTIDISSKCLNQCVICGIEGSGLRIAHIGETEEEKIGLVNLLKAISHSTLSITGKDPLMNMDSVDLSLKYHKGKKIIIFNPISFLTIPLDKPGREITKKDVEYLTELTKSKGLPKISQRIVESVREFDVITITEGSLQAAHPMLMRDAIGYFYEHIKPKIKTKNNKIRTDRAIDGCIEGGRIELERTTDPNHLGITGRLYTLYSEGKLEPWKGLKHFHYKGRICKEEKNRHMRFCKEGNKKMLYFGLCTHIGTSGHTSFRTSLSLEEMASISPERVKEKLEGEYYKFKESPLFQILNNQNTSQIEKKENFDLYIRTAQAAIYEKTGEKIDLIEETPSVHRGMILQCEVCYTISQKLKEAGISPREWQEKYLSKL